MAEKMPMSKLEILSPQTGYDSSFNRGRGCWAAPGKADETFSKLQALSVPLAGDQGSIKRYLKTWLANLGPKDVSSISQINLVGNEDDPLLKL